MAPPDEEWKKKIDLTIYGDGTENNLGVDKRLYRVETGVSFSVAALKLVILILTIISLYIGIKEARKTSAIVGGATPTVSTNQTAGNQ